MKRPVAIAWILASCVLVHCNLNPQPFPPNSENPTGAAGSAPDASVSVGPGADAASPLGNKSADATADAPAHAQEAAAADVALPFEDAGDASLEEDTAADGTTADAPTETDAPELNDAPSESEVADGEATADSAAGRDSEAGAD